MNKLFITILLCVPLAVFASGTLSLQATQNEILRKLSEFKAEIQKRKLDEYDIVGRTRYEQEQTIAQEKSKIFTVVIDAGHGGKDPGAIGPNGIREKDIVLSIAQKLAYEINAHSYMRAVLTRNGDYFVPLRARLKLARKGDADVFVAIHADASFNNDNALGASVYAVSERGATSEAARWLAQRDNYSELDGVELDSLPDHDPMLRLVMVDLAQTATIQDSIRLGNRVLDALDNISSLHYTHVERAPFVVLKSPDIPSILVETGFITNPREEARLANPAYQDQLAHALWKGVNRYFQKYGARRV